MRILRMLREMVTEEWKCLAGLIDNAFDDFNGIIILHYFRGCRAAMSILTVREHSLRPALQCLRLCCGALCWLCCCRSN
jgi:hypothetical protein